MKSDVKEFRKASIVAWGGLIITLLVTDRLSTDPVNLGKQLALSAFAFSLIPFLSIFNRATFKEFKVLLSAIMLFLSTMLASALLSQNVFERGLYGSFGRNTGFLTYFSLTVFFIAAMQLKEVQSFERIMKFFIVAGTVNVVYCLAAANGYDFFKWVNPYDTVLGTFGNPNFIGAFMGMCITVVFVHLISNLKSIKQSVFYLLLLILSAYVIILSNALQGILVAGFGISLAIFFYVRSLNKYRPFLYVYVFSLIVTVTMVLLGILQKGPLSNFLYKPSVTFRGEYWKTGINMWTENPIFGVGIDSYGQFFRTFRSLSATVRPGMETTTDAAHNVYIDILAGTGVFGFIGYVAISSIVIISAAKFIKHAKEFDPVFYSILLGWATFQLQSLVSINQIGLAIWGWILGGSTIAYSRTAISQNYVLTDTGKIIESKRKKSRENSTTLLDPAILIKSLASFLIGFLIALPPFLNDAKMRTILAGKGTQEQLVSLVKQWPRDSNRMSRAYVILAQNDSANAAKELAAFTTTIFPNDYSSWYALYQIAPNDTPERAAYKQKLHEIDPYNPAYFK
jgi:O-antigen ligase